MLMYINRLKTYDYLITYKNSVLTLQIP